MEKAPNLSAADNGSGERLEDYDALSEPKTKIDFEAEEVVKLIENNNVEELNRLVTIVQDNGGDLVERLHIVDVLFLASKLVRRSSTEESLGKIKEILHQATRVSPATDVVTATVFKTIERRMNTQTILFQHPSMERAYNRFQCPLDVVYKKYDQSEELSFLEIPDGYASLRKRRTVASADHVMKRFVYIGNDYDIEGSKRAHAAFSEAESVKSVLEAIGEYVPAASYSELQALVANKDLNISADEFIAVAQSFFMKETGLISGFDWESLTLREQVHAVAYLKSLPISSPEASLAETFIATYGANAVAAFQFATTHRNKFETLMRVLLTNRDFEKKILSVFRALANAGDRIEELIGTDNIFTSVPMLDEDVQLLREKMLRRGIKLLDKYVSLFNASPDGYREDLSEEELLDFIPIEYGGRAITPLGAERIMREEIEDIRIEATVYAEFIIQEYRENPESIHEALKTDFHTLTPEEIASMEAEFVQVLKANRERYITDELELAARILQFREDLQAMKTDPKCPMKLQTFTFKDNLIGFNTVEHIGDPDEKRIRVESFSLEPDVQHPFVGHAHIQKIMLDVYDQYTIEGEVHRDNKKLLQTYIKKYGFQIVGPITKDGKEYVAIRRLPGGGQVKG